MTAVPRFSLPVSSTLPDVRAVEQTLPHTACVGLGSNLGDSLCLLLTAWRLLQGETSVRAVRLSSPYRSDPRGMRSAHRFVNAAALVRTGLTPFALLERLHRIETRCGRTRPVPERPGYQDRTLDLDLLLFDDRVIHTGELILPHPRMHERLFVLAPLAEIAPAMVHPLLCRPVAGLLQDLQQADPDQRVERLRWPEPPCIRL